MFDDLGLWIVDKGIEKVGNLNNIGDKNGPIRERIDPGEWERAE
jgi:hypothetical protein